MYIFRGLKIGCGSMNFERTNLTKMGKYIAQQRKMKGYTQKQLAEFLDVTDKTISKWEQGIVAPDITILKPLAQVLDTNVDSIVNGEHYNSIFKYTFLGKKYILIILLFIFTVVVASFSFYMGGKGKYNLYKLQSFGVLNTKGYLISSDDESILVIKEIILNDTTNSVKNEVFKTALINIYFDDKLIFTYDYDIGKTFTLQEFLNDRFINIESKEKIDKSRLKIEITLCKLNGVEVDYSIIFP